MSTTYIKIKKISHNQGRNKLYFTKLKVKVGKDVKVSDMIVAVQEYVIGKMGMQEIVPKTLAYRLLPAEKIRFMFMCMCRPKGSVKKTKKGKK